MHVRSIAALALPLALVISATSGPAQPEGKAGWDEREGKVLEALEHGKWADGRKRARKLLNDVQEDAWEAPGVAARLARLGRYLAVAEVNLGLDREGIWHWLSAWNLETPTDLQKIASLGRADILLEYSLRPLGEMPPGFSPLHDLELLQLEPAEINTIERPVLANSAARRAAPVHDLQVELLIDRRGQLLHPVVDRTGVQAVAVWATLDWLLAFPPAQPATYDGKPVDALQPVTVTFGRDRKPASVFERH